MDFHTPNRRKLSKIHSIMDVYIHINTYLSPKEAKFEPE